MRRCAGRARARRTAVADSVLDRRAGSPDARRTMTQSTALHLVAAALLLCGCASYERYEPLKLDPTSTEAAFRARSLSDPELLDYVRAHLHEERAQEQKWDLSRLTLAAFFGRLDLAAMRSHLAVVRAGVGTAAQRPNPSLDLHTQFNLDSAPGQSPWILGFGFSFPIETGEKRERRVELARALVRAAEIEGSEALWHARSAVRAACVELAFSARTLASAQERRDVLSNVATAIEQRLQAGEVARIELDQVRAELAGLEVELEAARTTHAKARGSLSSALGLPPAAGDGIEIDVDDLAAVPPRDLLDGPAFQRAGLANRLDVQRRLAEVVIADADLRQDIAKQYPNLSLGPGYEWDQEENKFGVAASVELPVFHHHQAQVDEARSRRDEAAARFLATQAEAIGRIEAARLSFTSALSELDRSLVLTTARRAAQASIERGVDAGELDRLESTRARLAVFEAERLELLATRRTQDALGALEDAIQRPLGRDADELVPMLDATTPAGTPP